MSSFLGLYDRPTALEVDRIHIRASMRPHVSVPPNALAAPPPELEPLNPPFAYFGRRVSERESEVLQLITHGQTNRQIAAALGISEQTVKNHISKILRKLGASDRTQAAMIAVRRGWFGGLAADGDLIRDDFRTEFLELARRAREAAAFLLSQAEGIEARLASIDQPVAPV